MYVWLSHHSSLRCIAIVYTRKPHTFLPSSQSPTTRLRHFRPPSHVASPKILKKFVLLCTRGSSSSPSPSSDDDDKDAVLKEIIPSNSVLPSPSSPSSDELVDCNKERSFVETYGRLFSTLNEASLQHEPGKVKEVSQNVIDKALFFLPKWKNKMEKIKQTQTRDKTFKKE